MPTALTKSQLLKKIDDVELFRGDRLLLPPDLVLELPCEHDGNVTMNCVIYEDVTTVTFGCTHDGCTDGLSIECTDDYTDYLVV